MTDELNDTDINDMVPYDRDDNIVVLFQCGCQV